MTAYYNELDPFAAAWLRELIADGLIADGDVDERSIVDVCADDLAGYDQHHFFAGIGGWSYALRLAGWDDDREVWTGSCPCQPFSVSGKQRGHADSRHLWPAFHALIAKCKPSVVLGEQVASKIGREWFSAVRLDLEAVGYACGGADISAASVGAPHIRQRLWWVGHADRAGSQGRGFNAAKHADQLSPWASGEFISCSDGKARLAQPGILPVADGFPNRVGLLRGAGNAIVPQVAAKFIEAVMEV